MFDDKNIIKIETSYKVYPGSFGKPKLDGSEYCVNSWFDCRELWHSQLYGLKIFFYTHKPSNGKNIAEFVSKAENILNIKNKSHFGPTQKKTIMWIKPSSWWIKPPMRRSLFTIILRSSETYCFKKDNFEEALYSNLYAMSTKEAIEWFFKGNTIYQGKMIGWNKQFMGVQDQKTLSKLLISQTKKL